MATTNENTTQRSGSPATDLCNVSQSGSINSISAVITELQERNNTPVMGEALVAIEEFFDKYNIVPAVSILCSFVKSGTTAEKAAHLYALAALYKNKTMVELLVNNASLAGETTSFFSSLLAFLKRHTGLDVNVPDEVLAADAVDDEIWSDVVKQGAINIPADAPKHFNPLEGLNQSDPEAKTFFQHMNRALPIIRPVLGGLAFVACAMGFDKMLEIQWLAEISKNVVKLAATIKAKHVIWAEVTEGTDNLLSMIYGAFGEEYYKPEEKALQEVSQRINTLRDYVQKVVDQSKIDVFGLLRCESLDSLNKTLMELERDLLRIQTRVKSNINFAVTIQQISTNIQALRDRRNNLISGGYKQTPVRVWFTSGPGNGKTYWANKLAVLLGDGRAPYPRSPHDEYSSGYIGQAVYLFDDILQSTKKDSPEVDEFMRATTEASMLLNMASLEEKGTPFTSRFIVCTSNFAYCRDGTSVSSLEAFDRRRDYLIHTYVPGLQEWKQENSGEPQPDWYAAHPTRFFLFDPIGPHKINPSPRQITGIPTASTPGFIGEIQFEQLVDMCREMENCRSEKLRKHMLSTIGANNGMIAVPTEPFKYDEKKFDVNFMFDKVTKLPIDRSPHNLPIRSGKSPGNTQDSFDEDWDARSNIEDDVTKQIKHNPVTKIVAKRAFALTIAGPPGIGKSHIVLQFFAVHQYIRLDSQYIAEHPNWLAEIKGKDKFVFFDDFSVNDDILKAYMTAIEMASRGALPGKGLIGTCNWKLIHNKEAQQMIKRRSCLLTLSLSNVWAGVLSKETTEAYLKRKCGDSLAKRSEKISIKATGERSDLFSAYSQLIVSMEYFFQVNEEDESITITGEFELPPPTHYDYCIDLDVKPGTAISEVIVAVLSTNVYRRIVGTDGEVAFEKVGFEEKSAMLYKMGNFFGTKAYGSLAQFTRVFNEEKHPRLLDGVLYVKTWLGHMGFISQGDYTYAFAINEEDDQIQIIDGEPHYQGKLLTFTPGNAHYKSIITKVFDSAPPALPPPVMVNKHSMGVMLMRSSFLGQCLGIALSVIPLMCHGMAIATLLRSAFSSPSAAEEEEQSATTNSEGSGSGPSAQGNQGNGDQVEGKDRPQHDQQQNNAGYTPSDKASPSGNVKVEAQQRPQHQQNSDKTAYTPSDNQQPKSACKIEGQKQDRPVHTSNSALVPYSHQDHSKSSPPLKAEDLRPSHMSATGADKEPTALAKRNRNEHNFLTIEAAPYDRQTARATIKPVYIETLCWNDGMILFEPHNQYYGIAWNNMVVYAAEFPQNCWKVLAVPQNDVWKPVEPSQYNVRCYGREWKPRTNLSADTTAISAMVGCQFTTHDEPQAELSSILAFTFVYGVPYDAYAEKCNLKMLRRLFNAADRTPLPRATRTILERHDVNYALEFDHSVSHEGMLDPTLKQQSQMVMKQTHSITSNGEHALFGIGIGKRYVLTVAHLAMAEDPHIKIDETEWPITLCALNKTSDLAIFEIQSKQCPEFRNISHCFLDGNEIGQYMGNNASSFPLMITVKDPKVEASTNTLGIGECLAQATTELGYRGRRLEYRAVLSSVFITGLTLAGECGSPVFLVNKAIQGKLLAIHHSGNAHKSVASIVTKQWINEILANPSAIAEHLAPESSIDVHPQLLKCHDSITLTEGRIDERTGLLRVGELPAPIFAPTSTRSNRTGIEIDCDFEPSIMSSSDPRPPYPFEPKTAGLAKYGVSYLEEEIDKNEVLLAADEIANDLCNRLLSKGKYVREFSNTEVLNTAGVLEYPNAKPLDRSGSAGFPHCIRGAGKTKGDYMMFNDKNAKWYFRPEASDIPNQVNRIIMDAAQGREHIHPFIAYCKDEPLKKKKIYEVPKTRIFFSCPFEYLICFRRFFNSAMYRVQELYAEIPPKIGISATMVDWHYMVSRFRKMSPYGFASDVASFDASVPKIFIQACGTIWNTIYQRCSERGEDYEQGNIIRNTLHRAIEGAYVINRRSLYKLTQAQVSGNPATAIENSYVIWMLYYLVWRRLAVKHAPEMANYISFKQNVELACYGDDNICAVNQGCQWFNFNSFKREAKRFGFSITDALKKGGDVPDFQPLEELDFLKRGFKSIKGLYVGPLEMDSIKKALYWIRDKKYEVTKEVVGNWPTSTNWPLMEASVNALWSEMALHGEDTYIKMRDHLLREAHRIGITLQPPTWKQAMKELGYAV